jgi:AAA domain/Bifunctional DNA primase/polymerase, N-terminal/Primase C terminal 1 (PriCT-1)
MDDARPDELLEECGRIASRLRLALAWSDGIQGAAAKACSRGGADAWKRAQPIPENEDAAAAYFKRRARRRNPAVVAGASGLVLAEADGELGALLERSGLPAPPPTIAVRSARGRHLYFRPPAGKPPLKVQFAEDGITASSDGYLIGAGALHPTGWVYRYENGAQALAKLPTELYELIVRLGQETDARTWHKLENGEPIPKGSRDHALFHQALVLLRAGERPSDVLEQLLQINREQCLPPLDEALVRKQFKGAVKYAQQHPTVEQELRRKARQLLDARKRGSGETRARKTRAGLFLPFVDVQLTGPPRWLWRGKVPEGAVSLLAGRPKLGKSLLTVWLAAQLSRGLLEGDYREQPARTLLIAAEDPPDLIVKPRLIAAAADESLVGTLVQDRQDRQDRPREEVGGLGGLDGAGTYARRITIPDEYELLEQIVVENEVALVVLDPINSFITHKVDAHRDAEIRRVLDPLAALAARRRFSSLAVVHLNRRSDTDILNRITGSAGYGGSARSILTFGRHPENPVQRVVAAEGNWQKESQSDLFEIREVVVFPDVDPDDQTQPALVHIGVSELESSDLIDQFDDERTAIEEAKDYLYGELVGGPVPVADLRRGAEANGLSWRTVERAKKLLGVEARRVSSASSPRGAGRWEWFLELIEDDQQQEGATP